ncbi:MarR family winged helix-turn-helix transcriptional regulator [Yinghuangia soli]|uniref:MarR family transcriptional regulator n=1 Tax=Yinghuangia soli TaxID=2908204 RepID=A0AA41Q2T5_9ACTN|nr:MarR family transcriptional regulator [Yinghuangia soli]MCF2530276.1 MarR family transcriptional regulator [Yinghuangia soli]
MTDAELAGQPVGYWTGVAYEAVIGYIREQQAGLGFTQPQYWMLRHLSKNDISVDGRGMSIAELVGATQTYLREEDDLAAEAEVLLERGWVTRDGDGRLWITEAGDAARADLKTHAPEWRAAMHEGIDDADYVTALKVLRQMMRNVGSPLV